MKIFKLIILVCFSSLLVACLGPVKMPNVNVYTLKGPQYLKIPRSSRSAKTLLVSMPIANPGFASSKMVYVVTPYSLRYFSMHQWIAPPAQMILPILADIIRSKGYFKAVLTPPFSGMTNYRLDTSLIAFEQDFIQPISRIRLVMQASIVDNATNKVLASRRFSVVMPTEDNNPYSGVLTANRAVGRLSRQIAQFVLRSV